MTEKTPDQAYDASGSSEQITDPERITRLLEKLARQNSPLTVRIPGDKELYTSCTVGVDGPHVMLDELMPTTGHQLLLEKQTIKVSCKLDGVDIRFIVTLHRVDQQNNLLTYYMNLPAQLEYRQRRMDFRVNIPISMKLRVIIDNDTAPEIELHDLSHGGAGLIVPATDTKMGTGQLYECAIELPEDTWLYCTLEMRYSKTIPSRDRQHTGARFIDLHPAQKRMIGRCISELEREFIRKRAAYEY